MDTLVLSAAYEPVDHVPWQRAMTLIFAGRAEVVDEYSDRHIRTVSLVLPTPSVIRYLRYSHRKRHGVTFSRQNVYMRDRGRCQYCRQSVPRHESTFDHVIPRSQGGGTSWENVVIACLRCNQRKGGRTPGEARMPLAKAPMRPPYMPPAYFKLTLTSEREIPDSWRAWLPQLAYWYGELDHD